jgi:hypothetical protein
MTINCRVCNAPKVEKLFSAYLLDRSVDYFECKVCEYVQTEAPTWLDEAYASAIHNCDTGIMARNQANVGLVLATLTDIGQINGRVVDCAGGYGILVRLLRDRGIDAMWSDPYCKNLLAVGFEHANEKADLVTAFEAFEHFVDPLIEADKLFAIAPNLLISTSLIASPAPPPNEWWYYGVDHGQHIGFFRLQTLKFIAQKFGKQLVSDGMGCHLFTDKPISSWQWNLSVRIGRRLPIIFGRRLNSKILEDYEKMSKSL